jgi:cephalosporin hydroxylase
MTDFDDEVTDRIAANAGNGPLREAAAAFLSESIDAKYSYNFSWLGRPIIQYPQDIVAMQELVWAAQPDLIVETGIAHGGSLILWSSLLELNAACGGPPDARVVGIDIDIRAANRAAIEAHPLAKRIEMIEGSSVDPSVVARVEEIARDRERVVVCLDSNHTHDHVLAELERFAPLVTVGSYCVVFDTLVEDLGPERFPDRPWDVGNNPKTAVAAFLGSHPEFEVDHGVENKLLITASPGGYLKRTRA